MLTAVLSGFGLSIAAPWIYRFGRGATGWLLALLPAGLFVYFASFIPRIAAGERIATGVAWAPSLGVSLSFSVDGLSLLFALLINGIGALILIYGGSYLAGHHQLGRFYAFLLLFMGSMQGVVLADNVLTLFVFWELTSISSFLLIGFNHEKRASRVAAIQALLVTGGGGLALLAGLILMGIAGGSYELSALLTQGEAIRADARYLPILVLVLVGAFTKSAQAPFHFWLPNAMEAPTPVSAYLHSATMVKAGVYLLARLSPILGGTGAWTLIVATVGAATMLMAGAIALRQTDLKRLLAYSTISALGTLVMLLGLGSAHAVEAAMVFLLAHALYKGAMFLIAGIVDHETGTRDVEKLRGLRRAMPVTAAIAALAAFSMASFGPVVGFIGKELMLESVLEAGRASVILVPIAVFAGAAFVTVAAIVGVRPFVGEPQPTPKPAHEAPAAMRLGPAILALAGPIIGLAPGAVGVALVGPAVSAVLGHAETVDLHLWAGVTPALGLSVLSLVLGLGFYARWVALRRTTAGVEPLFRWGPARGYDVSLVGLRHLSHGVTGRMQTGSLRTYLLITLITTTVLTGATFLIRGGLPNRPAWSEMRFYEVGIAAVIVLAAVSGVFVRSRLGAVAVLSVVGSGIGVFYLLYSAPDLAMTQVLVETLSVLLYVFVFFYLPRFPIRSTRVARTWDAIVAISTGALMTALVLAATATPPDSHLATFFAENSKTIAHGSNIVNVILVDFRGLDTMGEITVLSVAAIGVFALLKLRPRKG